MIELPEFMTGRLIERTYGRARELREESEIGLNDRKRQNARAHFVRGMNMARQRSPRMLLFLEKGADYLQHRNDEQQSRISQEGFAKSDFTEFATWRAAYQKVCEPGEFEDAKYRIYGWLFAAVSEALP